MDLVLIRIKINYVHLVEEEEEEDEIGCYQGDSGCGDHRQLDLCRVEDGQTADGDDVDGEDGEVGVGHLVVVRRQLPGLE